jgi:hypothetical protein
VTDQTILAAAEDASIEGTYAFNTRRAFNKLLALKYVKAGIAVFPSSGDGNKTPLVKCFQKRDVDLTPEEIEAATREHEESGRKLVHLGATTDPVVIRRLWRAYPDAMPSISTGPNGLLVVDPDRKKDGPRLLRAAYEAHGGIPADVPVTQTRDGGMHLYFTTPSRGATTPRA